MSLPTLPLEHLNQAAACHVEILVRGAAVRQTVPRERIHEHVVDALGLEDLRQFADNTGPARLRRA